MEENENFSTEQRKSKRSYSVIINKTSKGDSYLKLSEDRETLDGIAVHNIIVFEEHIKEFSDALKETLSTINELNSNQTN